MNPRTGDGSRGRPAWTSHHSWMCGAPHDAYMNPMPQGLCPGKASTLWNDDYHLKYCPFVMRRPQPRDLCRPLQLVSRTIRRPQPRDLCRPLQLVSRTIRRPFLDDHGRAPRKDTPAVSRRRPPPRDQVGHSSTCTRHIRRPQPRDLVGHSSVRPERIDCPAARPQKVTPAGLSQAFNGLMVFVLLALTSLRKKLWHS